MNRFLIVIPSFNEEQNIAGVLEGLLQLKLQADIAVINDGSKDRTSEVASRFPVTVISHPCNLGYGAALQTGYKYAVKYGYEYVLQFDADGQHDPRDLISIIEEINRGEAEIVMGSRYIADTGYSAGKLKMAAVLFFRWLIFRLTKVKVSDPTTGLRGISHPVFHYYAGSGRFPADFPDADMLIHMILRKYRIKEIPAHMHERRSGVSMHAGIKPLFYMAKIMLSILLVLIRNKRANRTEMKAGAES